MQAQPKPQRLLRFHSVFLPPFFSKAEEKYGEQEKEKKKSSTPSRSHSYSEWKKEKQRGADRDVFNDFLRKDNVCKQTQAGK